MDRLDVLRSMLEQDPRNAFARYGVAMEYVNQGDHARAVAEFETLLGNDPDYVPGYYHAGRALEKLGRIDEARAVYENGISVARRKGDQHAASELQAALDMVGLT
jgi:Tfp pilus assembly protein PilF